MGTCSHCGSQYLLTRSTRKYCTARCKTNACLERKPRRIRAAEVEALHQLLHTELPDVDLFRERLRSIIAPHLPSVAMRATGPVDRPLVPTLD